MAGTFSNILFHIVFSIKERRPFITTELQPRLYEYLGGIVRNEGGTLYEIGGTADHVHLLLRWKTDGAVSDLMRGLKRNSSAWVHDAFPRLRDFYWRNRSRGYGP